MNQNLLALILSYVYVFGIIGLGELLRRARGYSTDFTRKFIHIGVGMWAYGTVWLFADRAWAVIPPLSFVVINAISYRQQTFKAMETGERGQLGTIYFPLSFAAVIWLLWEQPHLLVASLMPMTWGDALAAVVGQRRGRRVYTVLGRRRTLEGSLTMFLASLVATFLPLWGLPASTLSAGTALGAAAVTALVATITEALSPWGVDNLTVPALSVLVLNLLG